MSLSLAARIEKNKISTDSVWLVLLEIQLTTPIYLVRNTENIVWNNIEWLAFPFQIGDINDDGKEDPSVTIKVSNISRQVGVIVSDAGGGGGTLVVLRVVNSAFLDEAAVVEETFQVTKTNIDANWVTFTIGIPIDMQRRFPMRTVLKNFCPYKFKDIECGYAGTEIVCNKTLTRCQALSNSARYGGKPGLAANL
jgi:lambda family phage minor tail protein L